MVTMQELRVARWQLEVAAQRARLLGGGEHAQALISLTKNLCEPELRVAVFGEFSVGKSTLINALLGRRLLPAKAKPTTGHTTWIISNSTDELRVFFTDGQQRCCRLDTIDEFAVLDIHSRARGGIERLEVSVSQVPLLQHGLVLIDTPGTNDADEQTHRARQAVMQSDVVLFVINANQALGIDERKQAVNWMRGKLGKEVILVVNRMNQVEVEERAELRKFFKTWAEKNLDRRNGLRLYEVDALGALRYALRIAGVSRPRDDFFRLQTQLESLVGDSSRALQRSSRTKQLRATVAETLEWNRKLRDRLRTSHYQVTVERYAERAQLLAARRKIEASKEGESARLSVVAGEILREGFQKLRASFVGKDEITLKRHACAWLDQALAEAVKSIETRANDRLQALTETNKIGVRVRLTLSELISIEQRAAVEIEQKDNSGAVVAGALAGAITGFFIGGPVGAILGFFLVGGATDTVTVNARDHVAGYIKAAQEDWKRLSTMTSSVLTSQFDARINSLLTWIDDRCRALDNVPIAAEELSEREGLHDNLTRLIRMLATT